MRRNLLIGLVAFVAFVAAVAAVSAGKTPVPADAPRLTDTGPTEQSDGETGGNVAAFTAKDIDGRTVQVSTGKPGALFFFAGWCGSCIPEAQALDRVQGSTSTPLMRTVGEPRKCSRSADSTSSLRTRSTSPGPDSDSSSRRCGSSTSWFGQPSK